MQSAVHLLILARELTTLFNIDKIKNHSIFINAPVLTVSFLVVPSGRV